MSCVIGVVVYYVVLAVEDTCLGLHSPLLLLLLTGAILLRVEDKNFIAH